MTTVLPTEGQVPARGAAASWRILPLAMLVVALAHFNRISITVAGAEQIIPHAGVSDTRMGLVYSSFLVLYTAFMIPGGWFIDRFGPRVAWLVLTFGSAVFVTLTGVVGLACAGPVALFAGLLVVRSLLGVVNAPLHPTGARLVGNWIPPSGAALANGLITGAALVGITCTYILFGRLIDWTGWPAAFLVTGGVTLAAALAWAVLGADYPQARAESVPDVSGRQAGPRAGRLARLRAFLAEIVRHRSLVLLTLSYGAVGYFQYLFFYWAQYYFDTALHVPKEDSRAYSSILSLAMGAGMVLGGWLADRVRPGLGPRLGMACVPVAGLVLSALLTPAGLFLNEPAAVLIPFALAMVAVGMCEGPFWAAALQLGGPRGGTAAGVMNTGGNAVGLLAPALTPWLAEWFGWEAGIGAACVVCLAGAALWLWIDPAERWEGAA
jgi:MFS family permease